MIIWTCRAVKQLIALSTIAIFTLGWVSSATAMTYRDNTVNFYLGEGGYSLRSGKFIVESHSVTSGEDPDDYIYDGLTKSMQAGNIKFRIGRKGSSDVARWFNSNIPSNQTTFNHSADKLNFAFLGVLKLNLTGGIFGRGTETFTFSNIGIAQGHSGGSNNWWFGGQNCQNISNANTVICKGVNSRGLDVEFLFRRGGNDVNRVEVTPYSLTETREWMGRVKDHVRLDQLVMPRSHDAGMSETHHCHIAAELAKQYVLTQDKSVGGQLVDGSRWLDIRVDYDHGKLVTYHRSDDGIGCNGQDLQVVLDEAVAFVKAHKSETAILEFSHIRSDRGDGFNIKNKIEDLLSSYDYALYRNVNKDVNLAEVMLGDVRGKIILVFDYSAHIDTKNGRFDYKEIDPYGDCRHRSYNLTVCNEYSNTPFYRIMKNDQLGKWTNSAGLSKGRMFLLPWTLTPVPVLSPGVKHLAALANHGLPGVLYDQIVSNFAAKPNIVSIDFMNSQTAQSIIQYNFR